MSHALEDAKSLSGSHSSDEEQVEADGRRGTQEETPASELEEGGAESTPEAVEREEYEEGPPETPQETSGEGMATGGKPMEETKGHASSETVPNLRAAAARVTGLEGRELPPEPLTAEEALHGPRATQWREAMDREWQTLQERGTWVLEELPEGRRPVGLKWVFKIKTKPDGSLDKFKARLVAKGYSQVQGVDFLDTYAPVSRFTTLRVLLALGGCCCMWMISLYSPRTWRGSRRWRKP
jgi:hypothetical protein